MVHRVQLRRTKGWRMPENTVKVDRSTGLGNQFAIVVMHDGRYGITRWPDRLHNYPDTDDDATFADTVEAARAEAVRRYREWLRSEWGTFQLRSIKELIRGKDLACCCPLGHPCHADVLLELANLTPIPETSGEQ